MSTQSVTPNIQGLPPGATLKSIQGLPPGATLKPVNASQPSSDTASDQNSSFLNPSDLWEGAKNFVKQTPLGLVPALAHPIDAVTGAAKSIYGNAKSEGKEAIDAAKQGSYGAAVAHGIQAVPVVGQAMKQASDESNVSPIGDDGQRDNSYLGHLGNLVSSPKSMGTLAGASATLALPAAKGIKAAGGGQLLSDAADAATAPARMARTAAVGDTDAAALKGLQVGPKSKAQLGKLESIQASRPYLQGAESQADIQGRLRPAMDEVWNPYSTATDAIGDRPVQGPDGPTTVRELENERLRLSALNRGVKSGNPSDIQQAMQEGRTPAQLIQREADVQAALDPHLESTGIKPAAIRGTYGSLADVRDSVEGKTTLNEKPQPSGFGRMMNLDVSRPKSFIGEPMQGARDLIAGRPLWSAKPTDLGIREGFSVGGEKPDLGKLELPDFEAPRPMGLPRGPITMPRPETAGGTPEGFRPPNFYHDTDVMRKGRLLDAPPIELPGEIHTPQQSTFRYDTTPMRQGRILPPPTEELPPSSYNEIFPEQIPQATRVRPKIIEGKK